MFADAQTLATELQARGVVTALIERGSASGGLFRELYDLQVDPFELANLPVTAPADPTVLAVSTSMANRLALLRLTR